MHSDVAYPDGCYLVFGKETAGLPEELLLQHPDNCVRIPMLNNPDARSLNLSNRWQSASMKYCGSGIIRIFSAPGSFTGSPGIDRKRRKTALDPAKIGSSLLKIIPIYCILKIKHRRL